MLKTQEKTQEDWHLIVDAKEGARVGALLHERQIWSKEEAIVVIANEAMPGGECFPEAIETLANRLSWCLLGHDGPRTLIFIHFCGVERRRKRDGSMMARFDLINMALDGDR